MEIWKDIPELDGRYQCSNYGRIRRVNKDPRVNKYKILNMQETADGYVSVNPTTTYRKRVHRIVATLFIPNPEGKPLVNHKDFNTKNNHVDNLEWVTFSENSQHSQNAGRLGRMCIAVMDTVSKRVFDSMKFACEHFRYPYKYANKIIKEKGSYRNIVPIKKSYKIKSSIP